MEKIRDLDRTTFEQLLASAGIAKSVRGSKRMEYRQNDALTYLNIFDQLMVEIFKIDPAAGDPIAFFFASVQAMRKIVNQIAISVAYEQMAAENFAQALAKNVKIIIQVFAKTAMDSTVWPTELELSVQNMAMFSRNYLAFLIDEPYKFAPDYKE